MQAPIATLSAIQSNFHAVMRERAGELIDEHQVSLPDLGPLLTADEPEMWFSIPGMYGGFKFWLEFAGEDTKLFAESWCRVVDGSGQRHEVTASGSQLIAEGFV